MSRPVSLPVVRRRRAGTRRVALVLVAALSSLGLATTLVGTAGAATADFDIAKARKAIAAQLRTTYPGLEIGTVRCPKKVKNKVGRVFECTTTVSGAPLTVQGTVGRSGRYTVTPLGVLVTKVLAEDAVKTRVTLPATAVDCGAAPVHVVQVGGTVACTATLNDGSKLNVVVLVADATGKLNVQSA